MKDTTYLYLYIGRPSQLLYNLYQYLFQTITPRTFAFDSLNLRIDFEKESNYFKRVTVALK